jgi:hypothetical protein
MQHHRTNRKKIGNKKEIKQGKHLLLCCCYFVDHEMQLQILFLIYPVAIAIKQSVQHFNNIYTYASVL